MPRTSVIAGGQVAITTAAEVSGPVSDNGGPVNVSFANVGGSVETLVVTTTLTSGGTARRLARVILQANETLYLSGVEINGGGSLLAVTTNAASVDYVVFRAPEHTLFGVCCYDANGAIKSGGAAVGSGNLTVSGDLAVGGGDIDLGASGTAGTVDVFPSTASKGKLTIAAADSAGDTTTTVTNASQATTRTYTIPDALANANFLLGSQAAVARTATADGLTTGTIADKGLFQHITVTAGGDANSIIVLPTPTPGTTIVLNVGSTGFELRTSTPASIGINGGTGASAESAIPANSTVFMTCVSATSWKGFYMDADGDLAKVEAAA